MKNCKAPCDLHLHSYYSDGNMSPQALVQRAHQLDLAAVSITDHDTILGQEESLRAGKKYRVEVLTGIEFSMREDGLNIHIIGYLIDPANPALVKNVDKLGQARVGRAKMIVDKLMAYGLEIPFQDILEKAGEGTIGRPHIAQVLVKRGLVRSIQEAFGRYIGDGGPCYVPKTVLPSVRVFELIKEAGGVAIWAHPGKNILRRDLLERLCRFGIAGIEVWHPHHDLDIERKVHAAALEKGLIMTGGSDFHFREAMQSDMGEVTVPYETVTALKKAAI